MQIRTLQLPPFGLPRYPGPARPFKVSDVSEVSEVSEDSGAWDEDRMIPRARARRSRGRASTGVPGLRISERSLN